MSAAPSTPPLDDVLGELWSQLMPRDRRALALIGYCFTLECRLAAEERIAWPDLETADRMALIRAMSVVGELAQQCAAGLQLARASLDDHWREELLR